MFPPGAAVSGGTQFNESGSNDSDGCPGVAFVEEVSAPRFRRSPESGFSFDVSDH